MQEALSPFQAARDELARLGVRLVRAPGEYQLCLIRVSGPEPVVRRGIEDLAEALAVGREMSKHRPPPPLPPLGPTGARRSRRGAMIAHNRKLAARRARKARREA